MRTLQPAHWSPWGGRLSRQPQGMGTGGRGSFPRAAHTKGGPRDAGAACSCLYADLCMHRVQDLMSLTCFRKFWNRGTWWFHFLVVREDQVLSVIWGRGWHFGGVDSRPATCCPMSAQACRHHTWTGTEGGGGHCLCLLRARVRDALVRTTAGIVSVIFRIWTVWEGAGPRLGARAGYCAQMRGFCHMDRPQLRYIGPLTGPK